MNSESQPARVRNPVKDKRKNVGPSAHRRVELYYTGIR
jgi:hypothetical protein